jgi:hypothetical protein
MKSIVHSVSAASSQSIVNVPVARYRVFTILPPTPLTIILSFNGEQILFNGVNIFFN